METTIVILLSIIAACSALITYVLIRSSKKTQFVMNNKLDELMNFEKSSYDAMLQSLSIELKSILEELKVTKKDIEKGIAELKKENSGKIENLTDKMLSVHSDHRKFIEKSIKEVSDISSNLKESFEKSKDKQNENSVMINNTLSEGLENIVLALKESIKLE